MPRPPVEPPIDPPDDNPACECGEAMKFFRGEWACPDCDIDGSDFEPDQFDLDIDSDRAADEWERRMGY